MTENVWSGVTSCFELRKVSVTLNGNQVITRGDVEVRKGELLAVVGPSGAGKSTLLRCLNRLTEITTGEISFLGVPLHDIDPITLRRRVGMLFQLPVMFEGTVADNISYATTLGAPAKDVAEMLIKVGLDPSFANKNASTLSVGEQQRVCLARALVNSPEVLLMDEPTASLDPANTRLVEELMIRLKNEGITIVLVSHNMAQARRLGERVLLMKTGETMGTFPREEFFRDYGEEGNW